MNLDEAPSMQIVKTASKCSFMKIIGNPTKSNEESDLPLEVSSYDYSESNFGLILVC